MFIKYLLVFMLGVIVMGVTIGSIQYSTERSPIHVIKMTTKYDITYWESKINTHHSRRDTTTLNCITREQYDSLFSK